MALHYFHPFKSFLALFGPVLARFGPFLIQFQAKTPIFALLVEIFLGSHLNFKVADFLQRGAGAQHQFLPYLANKSNPQRGGGVTPGGKNPAKSNLHPPLYQGQYFVVSEFRTAIQLYKFNFVLHL